ncbi:hypothetical protein ACHAXM_001668 [Skeletonema potamos]|jgi:hypothetical protein
MEDHRKGTNNSIRRSRRGEGLRSKQHHAFVTIVVSFLLPSNVISQHNVSDTIPTHYPTYKPTTFNSTPTYSPTTFNSTTDGPTTHYPTYEPTASFKPTTHYPTYEPTASDSESEGIKSIPDSDSGGLGDSERSITDIIDGQDEGALPNDESNESGSQESSVTSAYMLTTANNAANSEREVTMVLAAAAAVVATVLCV